MTKPEAKLADCPFCGGPAGYWKDTHIVCCRNRDCIGERGDGSAEEWNTRAPLLPAPCEERPQFHYVPVSDLLAMQKRLQEAQRLAQRHLDQSIKNNLETQRQLQEALDAASKHLREAEALRADAERLMDALVYSAFMQHGTDKHMLPRGVGLANNDWVIVTFPDGSKVDTGPRPKAFAEMNKAFAMDAAKSAGGAGG